MRDKELDHTRMNAALEEARLAAARNEVPIGAVLVNSQNGDIVARAGNLSLEQNDPTAHAEMLVIRSLCAQIGAQRIPDYDLYVTLEPCPMCAAAISFARIRRLVIGAEDPKSGGVLHGPKLYQHSQLHHKPQVESGVLAEDSSALLKSFFAVRRR